jgi:hypothetical protein
MSMDTTNGDILLCVKVPIPKQRKICDLRQQHHWHQSSKSKRKIIRHISDEEGSSSNVLDNAISLVNADLKAHSSMG